MMTCKLQMVLVLIFAKPQHDVATLVRAVAWRNIHWPRCLRPLPPVLALGPCHRTESLRTFWVALSDKVLR